MSPRMGLNPFSSLHHRGPSTYHKLAPQSPISVAMPSHTIASAVKRTARSRKTTAAALLAIAANVLAVTIVFAGDSPHGYWWGTDSNAPQASGSFPYKEPYNTSGSYGGYFAEVDTYFDQVCGQTGRAVNSVNVADANTNAVNFANEGMVPDSFGTVLYDYMGGPGADPSYNGTAAEAYAWGERWA